MAGEFGLPGLGTTLQYRLLSTGSFTPVAGRTEIGGPGITVEQREITNLDSTKKCFRNAIVELGELSVTIYYDPDNASHVDLFTLAVTPPAQPIDWKLVFKDGKTTSSFWQFKGNLKGFEPGGMEEDGTLSADLSIQVTDSLAYTAGIA